MRQVGFEVDDLAAGLHADSLVPYLISSRRRR
jgi:hypothetical protein